MSLQTSNWIRFLFQRLKVIATKSNAVIVFIGAIVALCVDAFELTRIFGSQEEKHEVIENSHDTTQETKIDTSVVFVKVDTTFYSGINRYEPKPKKKEVELEYFNKDEFLTEKNTMALFIVDNNNLAKQFQQLLSNKLLNIGVNTSTSFFNNNSISFYNSFYTANPNWINKTKIQSHLNLYLIGNLEKTETKSTFDSGISIINLTFNGKLIDLNKNKTIVLSDLSSENSNYVKSKAMKQCQTDLLEKILESIEANVK